MARTSSPDYERETNKIMKNIENVLGYLVQSTPSEVVGDDDVSHGVEDELDILCVGGAGHVTVDLLGGALVLGLELGLDVGSRLPVLLCS